MKLLACAPTVALVACVAHTRSVERVRYGDGSTHFEYHLLDGVPDGVGRVWYPDGKLQSVGTYANGLKQGLFRYYARGGTFERQVFYWQGAEVWRSTNATAVPSPDLLYGLAAYAASGQDAGPERGALTISYDPVPAPYFATLDRTTSLSRAGVELGTGAIRRMDLFANYAFAHYGVYGELLETDDAVAPGMTLSGKETLEAGGTRRVALGKRGNLWARLGVLVPVGNDNPDGYYGSAAGAAVRPTDAATSFPSTVAIRTSASFVTTRRLFAVQADAGVDWLLAGQARPLDAVLHANLGVGVGVRAALVDVELTNAILASAPSHELHAVALCGTLWFARAWVTGALSYGLAGPSSLTVGVGYEL